MVLLLSGFSGGDGVIVENVEQAYLVGVVLFASARHWWDVLLRSVLFSS